MDVALVTESMMHEGKNEAPWNLLEFESEEAAPMLAVHVQPRDNQEMLELYKKALLMVRSANATQGGTLSSTKSSS